MLTSRQEDFRGKANMKRQKKYYTLDTNNSGLPMQKLNQPKFENSIEAEIQDGDTLQALALRFHCTVAEIKRLNKIDKDNEIYARKTIKIPINPHSVLLETIPIVHKSGQSTPKRKAQGDIVTDNPLKNNELSEKLLIASVNSANVQETEGSSDSINNTILNSRLRHVTYSDDHEGINHIASSDRLLYGELDESIPQPRPIPGLSKSAFDCSGSDCDISWICLFICILALCFAIPLVYVFYIAEHLEKFHHNFN